MAYPEPLLPLNAKKGKEFLERISEFKIDPAQKERIEALREKLSREARGA